MSHLHGSSCCSWLPYLRCGCHQSCDWNGQVGPRRATTTGRWDGTASVSVDTKLTNAEQSMRPITRNTVKMVAEHYYGTALYSALDNSCKVVAADPLSLIALSPWWVGCSGSECRSGRSSRSTPTYSGKTLQTRGQHIRTDKCWHSADALVRCHEGCAPQDRHVEDHH